MDFDKDLNKIIKRFVSWPKILYSEFMAREFSALFVLLFFTTSSLSLTVFAENISKKQHETKSNEQLDNKVLNGSVSPEARAEKLLKSLKNLAEISTVAVDIEDKKNSDSLIEHVGLAKLALLKTLMKEENLTTIVKDNNALANRIRFNRARLQAIEESLNPDPKVFPNNWKELVTEKYDIIDQLEKAFSIYTK